MALLLIIIGLVLLLATVYQTLGIILLVVGLVLAFAPGPYVGARRWPGRW